MLKEKHYIIHKIDSLLLNMDADTVLAFYSVATRLSQKGGNTDDSRRKKTENHPDPTGN